MSTMRAGWLTRLAPAVLVAGILAVPVPASAAALTLTVSPLHGVVSAPVTATASMPSPCGQLPPGDQITFRFTWDLTFVTFGTASTVCTAGRTTVSGSFRGLPPAAHNAQGPHTLGVFAMDAVGSPLGSAFAAYVISPPRPPRPSPAQSTSKPVPASGQLHGSVASPNPLATPTSSGECVKLAAAGLPSDVPAGDLALFALALTAALLTAVRRRRLRYILAVLLVVVAVTACSGSASVGALPPTPSPSTPTCLQ
jgi:hypothetical protein